MTSGIKSDIVILMAWQACVNSRVIYFRSGVKSTSVQYVLPALFALDDGQSDRS